MRRPVVGVIGSAHRIENRFATQIVGERNLRAVADVAGALPLMFAASPEITDIGALLDAVDGIVLTGARANVHPTHFRAEPHPAHEPYDLHRDDVALALSEACVARGIPLFGICRGLQEMNVAFGGSLHPEICELPGRMNHRMPRLENGEIHPDPKVVFADRHDVSLEEYGLPLVAGTVLLSSKRAFWTARSWKFLREAHAKESMPIEQLLIKKGLASDREIAQTYAEYLSLPLFDIPIQPGESKNIDIDGSLRRLLPEKMCREQLIAPLAKTDGTLDVAFVTPNEMLIIDEIQLLTGLQVRPIIAPFGIVEGLLDILYGSGQSTSSLRGRSAGSSSKPTKKTRKRLRIRPAKSCIWISRRRRAATAASFAWSIRSWSRPCASARATSTSNRSRTAARSGFASTVS